MALNYQYVTPMCLTEPIDGKLAGRWVFEPGCRVLILNNTGTQALYVLFNNEGDAGVKVHDIVLFARTSRVLILGEMGLNSVEAVSIWFPKDAEVTDFSIRGC